ncbi:hypothetical protein sS8_0143 [Methylocaldum marinum]|uniref:Uncharacterized protein n=1 Tax=Methylocaldum marinum TaxID=1432792 RepID=A0A286P389_9GAMM|nr:hypothetical protein sS8_0143 [Methylocaldum marinum]
MWATATGLAERGFRKAAGRFAVGYARWPSDFTQLGVVKGGFGASEDAVCDWEEIPDLRGHDRRSAIPCRRKRSTGPRDVGKGFPTLYYEFRVVRKGLEKTPDRSPQAWRALQV